MNSDILRAAGIDYDAGVARFMGDAPLYESIITEYPEDDTFAAIERAYRAGDYNALFTGAHTLKGLAGNIDFTDVFKTASELTELVRSGRRPEKVVLDGAFEALRTAQERVVKGIITAREA